LGGRRDGGGDANLYCAECQMMFEMGVWTIFEPSKPSKLTSRRESVISPQPATLVAVGTGQPPQHCPQVPSRLSPAVVVGPKPQVFAGKLPQPSANPRRSASRAAVFRATDASLAKSP